MSRGQWRMQRRILIRKNRRKRGQDGQKRPHVTRVMNDESQRINKEKHRKSGTRCHAGICADPQKIGTLLSMDAEWQGLDLRNQVLRRAEPWAESRLCASLLQVGQQAPIAVVGSAPFIVVDGFKRVRCLKRLGRDAVRVLRWDVDEAEALIMQEQLGNKRSALEEGWLLRELRDRLELNEEEAGKRLGRSKSWVSRRLSLVEILPQEIQTLVQEGKLQAYAAMKSLVPLARANHEHALKLGQSAAQQGWSTRQVAELYRVYLASSEKSRAYLMEHLELALKARSEVAREEAPELLRDAHAMAALGFRLHKKLQHWTGFVGPEERSRLQRALMRTQETTSGCLKEAEHVGQRKPDRDFGIEQERAGQPGHLAHAETEPRRGEEVPEVRESRTGSCEPERFERIETG